MIGLIADGTWSTNGILLLLILGIIEFIGDDEIVPV